MSVELVGTSGTSRMVLKELPALIGAEPVDETRSDGANARYLCLISQVDEELVVWDLGGKSGTLVNGSRITRATLRDSDTLSFGGNEFRVHSEQPPQHYMHGVRN